MVRVRNLVTATIVGSFVLGAASAALWTSAPAAAHDGVEVPSMKVGDQYRYLWSWLPPREPGDERPDEERWMAGGGFVVSVGPLGEALDHAGARTPFVAVSVELEGYDEVPRLQHVSLADRLVFQSVNTMEFGSAPTRLQQTSYTRQVATAPAGLEFQGATLVPGIEIPAAAFVQDFHVSSDHAGGGSAGFEWMGLKVVAHSPARHFSGALPYLQPADALRVPATVESAGAIEGRPAVKVMWSHVQSFGEHVFEYPTMSGRPGYTETTTVETLWTSALAVPVEYTIQVRTQSDDLTTRDDAWRYTLDTVEEGTTIVPWDAEPPEGQTLMLEESGALHPADGDPSALPYPLSRAIADVALYRTDPEWAVWHQTNPNARLVSAEFMPGATSWTGAPTWQWRLHFGTVWSSYEVRTERHPASPVPVVEGLGESDLPAARPWDDTPALLPISGAVDLWRETFALPAEAVPTYLRWGLWPAEWSSPGHCVTGIYSGDSPTTDSQWLLRSLNLGHQPVGPCYRFEEGTYWSDLQIALDVPALIAHREYWDAAPSS